MTYELGNTRVISDAAVTQEEYVASGVITNLVGCSIIIKSDGGYDLIGRRVEYIGQ